MNKVFLFIFLVLVPVLAKADSTITITLVNRSNHQFTLSQLKAERGSRISIDKEILGKNEKAIIKGTITSDTDLSAKIFFNNNADIFLISVNRLKKFGQPLFKMDSSLVSTNADKDSLVFNKDRKPTNLIYTAVTVYLD